MQIKAIPASSRMTTVIVSIWFAVVTIVVLGIVAVIVIPVFLRAHVAGNEASAIGTLRAISSAERTYASANQGYYATLSAWKSHRPVCRLSRERRSLRRNISRRMDTSSNIEP
jgi:Tfp pilus assembly protein PilE